MSEKIRQPGQPCSGRAATTIDANAKGKANTVCEILTNSAHFLMINSGFNIGITQVASPIARRSTATIYGLGSLNIQL